MTTTQHNNDHAAALELWEAMGEAGILPDGIYIGEYSNGETYLNITLRGQSIAIDSANDPDDTWWTNAIHVLTGHAERWLRGRGWSPTLRWWMYYPPVDRWDFEPTNVSPHSLLEAIRAEIGRE